MIRMVLVTVHPAPSPQAVPLACAYLKSALAGNAIDVQLLDFYLADTVESCADRIAAIRPTAVGFSIYLWNRSSCVSIARRLRQLQEKCLVFCGGPEATADPAGLLAGGVFDCVVVGEGEGPLIDICRSLAAGDPQPSAPGVAALEDGHLKFTPRAPLRTLDDLPSPWLNGTLDAGTYPGILWQLSRGCGFSCDFCFDSRDRHGVRRFSLERIEAELRHFADKEVTQVFVLDSTFNQDAARAKTILRLIRRIAPRIHFHFEVRSEFIDREMAHLFASIACSLQIGLQSADPRVLKGVGRSFDRADFARKAGLLNEQGAVFGFDLIYGLPDDSLDGFRASLDYALGLYPNHLDIFPLAILPGTALAERSRSIGLRHLPNPPYTLIDTPTFPADDMTLAAKLAAACDIFYTRGKAVAWFNGMLEAAGLSPWQFLDGFAGWLTQRGWEDLHEEQLDDERIWELQREFLTALFSSRNLRRFLPVLQDLATYHNHYAVALLSPVPQRNTNHRKLPRLTQLALKLNSGVRLAAFTYDIMELLEAGVADVRWFSKHLAPTGSWAVIYPADDGVRTESIDQCYFNLLQQLDGIITADRVAADTGLGEHEALEFLLFAFAEGIVTSA